jgi:hypothetical protein
MRVNPRIASPEMLPAVVVASRDMLPTGGAQLIELDQGRLPSEASDAPCALRRTRGPESDRGEEFSHMVDEAIGNRNT